MPFYYVNKNDPNGEHKVHRAGAQLRSDYSIRGCTNPPAEKNRQMLRYQLTMDDAVREVRKYYKNVSACQDCEANLFGAGTWAQHVLNHRHSRIQVPNLRCVDGRNSTKNSSA